MPGIGKSALIEYVLVEARSLRCHAYRGVGNELGQQLPLRALTDALGRRLAAEGRSAACRERRGRERDGIPAVNQIPLLLAAARPVPVRPVGAPAAPGHW